MHLNKSPLDKQGVIDFFTFRYNIQNGHTMFENIRRFHPGQYLKINLQSKKDIKKRYWRLNFREYDESDSESQDRFNSLLDKEIIKQTISDVPLGMYLSGGIDSGALLHGFSKKASGINAFTIRFSKNDGDFKRVNSLSNIYDFKKNTIPFDFDLMNDIEDVIFSLEEPFGDLIIVANYILSKFASKHVKVVLSGEGGDEAFLGYDHQRALLNMFKYSQIPFFNMFLSSALKFLPPKIISIASSYPGGFSLNELKKIRRTFSSIDSPSSSYINLVSLFDENEINHLFKKSFFFQILLENRTMPLFINYFRLIHIIGNL